MQALISRGRKHFSRTKTETGAMPGTFDSALHNTAARNITAIMGAKILERKDVIAKAGQHHRIIVEADRKRGFCLHLFGARDAVALRRVR